MIDFQRDFQSINFWYLMLFQIFSCYKYCSITCSHALPLILFVFFINFRKTYMFLIKNLNKNNPKMQKVKECCHPIPPRWPLVTFWFISFQIFLYYVYTCTTCSDTQTMLVCAFFFKNGIQLISHFQFTYVHISLHLFK